MLRKICIVGVIVSSYFWAIPSTDADLFAGNPLKKLEDEFRRGRDKVKDEYDRIEDQAKANLRRLDDQTSTNIRNFRDDVELIDSIIKETERAGHKTEDLGRAVGKYIERTARGTRDAYEAAFEAARSGNLVDAYYSITIQMWKNQEDYAARAVQNSSYLNTIANTAASVYGGPGGAAAYAAWYTYKATGDIDLAIKTGVITGATSYSLSGISSMPSSQWEQKALLAGAIGGTAIAASGGDSDAVWDGFLKGGGMVLVQDGYKEYVGGNLHGKNSLGKHSIGEAYCMGSAIGLRATDADSGCLPPKESWVINKDTGKVETVDITKTIQRRPHVGLWSEVSDGEQFFDLHERSGLMTGVSKVPGMNAMSIAHDKFAVDYNLNMVTTVATIPLAVVVTYAGLGAPTYGVITKTNIEEHRKSTPSISVDLDNEVLLYSKENTAKATFVCTQGGLTRTIVLDSPSAHPDFACRVIYQSEKGLKVLWEARNDVDYCEQYTEEFTAKQLGWGWSCLIQ